MVQRPRGCPLRLDRVGDIQASCHTRHALMLPNRVCRGRLKLLFQRIDLAQISVFQRSCRFRFYRLRLPFLCHCAPNSVSSPRRTAFAKGAHGCSAGRWGRKISACRTKVKFENLGKNRGGRSAILLAERICPPLGSDPGRNTPIRPPCPHLGCDVMP